MRIECRRIAFAMVVLTVWASIGRSEEPTARISRADGEVISKERIDTASPNRAVSPAGQTPLIRPVASEPDLATARWDRDTVREAARAGRKLTVKAFPLPNGRSVDLELRPFSISSSNSRFVVGRKGQPDRPADFDPTSISFFRGEVAGRPGSHVFLALGDLFSTGYVDLGAGAGRFEVSSLGRDGKPLTDGGLSVFQGAASANLPPGVELCGVDSHRHKLTEAALGLRVPEAQVAAAPPSTVGLKHMELAVDSDYEYFALIGEETAAIAYLHVVYGAVSDFFMRDVNVHIELVFTRVWTDPDDLFNGPDPLTEFWMEWEANMGAVSRDAAQLFSGRRNYQFGGQAFLSQLCNFGYGAIGYAAGFLPDPSKPSPFNWDAMVTAHELGHTFGAPHTHNLGLDTCDDGNTTPQRGSIMSYCGQTWSGMNANTDNYFHTTIRGEIFNHVSVSACVVPDCNMNNIDDAIDIAGASFDVNFNGIPDECEDCNENGTLDPADIAGASFDVNSNGIPDECEADCDNDGVPDDWEIALGAVDLYGNGLPDSCETDCNNNNVSDYTEIQANMPLDVDRTATLDSCQNCDGDSLTDHEELEGSHYLWVASGLSNSPVRQFFPSTGVLTTSSPVDTADTMDSGQDVLATSDGRVLVSSANGDRILAFDSDGSFLGNLVSSGAGGLDYPTGMVMTAAGKLYVASRNTDSVLIFDGTTGVSEGVLISSGLGGLAGPFGMTFGPNGNLFVTSSTNEVFEYDVMNAVMVGKFVDAADNGTLSQPRGLTFKADGNLLVASYGSDEVLEFDGMTGTPMGKWAKVGTETRITQDSPWGIRVGPDGHVFVT
ncbi:MAG: hypothetical protein IID35_11805, partial [Planctomycetes bacterium]|nr:hypothetical protein [Planctomycetota bacterium]